jgi:midasin
MDGEALENEMRTKDDDDSCGDEKNDESEVDEKKANDNIKPEQEDDSGKINDPDKERVQEKPMGLNIKKPENNDDADDISIGGKEEDSDGDGDGDGDGDDDMPNDEGIEGQPEVEYQLPEDLNIDDNDDDNEETKDSENIGEDESDNLQKTLESGETEQDKSDNEEDTNEKKNAGDGNIPEELPEHMEDPPEHKTEKESHHKHNMPAAYGLSSESGLDAILDSENEETKKEKLSSTDLDQSNSGSKGSSGLNGSKGDQGVSQDVGGSADSDQRPQQQQNQRYQPPNPFQQRGDINERWYKHLNILDRNFDEQDNNDEQDISNKDMKPDDPSNGKGLFEKLKEEEYGIDQVLDIDTDDRLAEDYNIPSEESQIDKEDDQIHKFESKTHNGDLEQDKKEAESRKRRNKNVDDSRSKRSKEDTNTNGTDQVEHGEDKEVMIVDEGELSDNEDSEGDVEGPVIIEDIQNKSVDKVFINLSSLARNPELNGTSKESKLPTHEDYDIMEEINYDGGVVPQSIDTWIRYRQETESQAIQLCEQLRLILEPTIASRLRGDYRTGKRLNMRRIISYVASGFRKDKIWLRRTKPAKREYQIMIMVDNSHSMAEAGNLALSSLAMVTTALTRLEVGDISLVSFADHIQVVHPFGEPFTDEAGSKAISHFNFTADRTLLSQSLEAVTPIFARAKSNISTHGGSNSSTILQLCFIISDARIDSDNRRRLEGIVREMAERHILVLLVIIDKNDNKNDSIFNTRTVEFHGNKLVTSGYMDNFPFPFYIVIQQLDGLSETLAEALKQWFELVRNQSSGR